MNCALQRYAINILDSIDEIGLDETKELLTSFSTIRSYGEDSLNEDIEIFLKKMQFNSQGKRNQLLIWFLTGIHICCLVILH